MELIVEIRQENIFTCRLVNLERAKCKNIWRAKLAADAAVVQDHRGSKGVDARRVQEAKRVAGAAVAVSSFAS